MVEGGTSGGHSSTESAASQRGRHVLCKNGTVREGVVPKKWVSQVRGSRAKTKKGPKKSGETGHKGRARLWWGF